MSSDLLSQHRKTLLKLRTFTFQSDTVIAAKHQHSLFLTNLLFYKHHVSELISSLSWFNCFSNSSELEQPQTQVTIKRHI